MLSPLFLQLLRAAGHNCWRRWSAAGETACIRLVQGSAAALIRLQPAGGWHKGAAAASDAALQLLLVL
jgi:hypothetical protein